MGMEASEVAVAAHHTAQQQQQRQQRFLADRLAAGNSMLSNTNQPTGGGLTQPLHQGQAQAQDPLQSIVQHLLYWQQLDRILGQRGQM